MSTFHARATTTDGKRVRIDANGRTTTLDLGAALGGAGEHPNPEEAVLAALGGCTVMTLHLYAARKGWTLGAVRLGLDLEVPGGALPPKIVQTLEIEGDLDEEQRARLLEIAGRCPVHRLLDGPLEIDEQYGVVPA